MNVPRIVTSVNVRFQIVSYILITSIDIIHVNKYFSTRSRQEGEG